jgi:hypothetical protein
MLTNISEDNKCKQAKGFLILTAVALLYLSSCTLKLNSVKIHAENEDFYTTIILKAPGAGTGLNELIELGNNSTSKVKFGDSQKLNTQFHKGIVDEIENICKANNVLYRIVCSYDTSLTIIDFKIHGIAKAKQFIDSLNRRSFIAKLTCNSDSSSIKLSLFNIKFDQEGEFLIDCPVSGAKFYPEFDTRTMRVSRISPSMFKYSLVDPSDTTKMHVDLYYPYKQPAEKQFDFIKTKSFWLFLASIIGGIGSLFTIYSIVKVKPKRRIAKKIKSA